jgi:pyruvate/2-oxoglutarate dehydrogenase complex dihydrolipoamide acyltransferase (E2) component
VHFVEDVHLVAGARRRIAHRVIDLADVVDAVVGGRIHLDDVDVPALHDGETMRAELWHADTRAGNAWALVVEGPRQDARGRGLADPANAGEDPGLRNTAGIECVAQRAHHRVLADDVVEGGGSVFAREHAIAAAASRLRKPEIETGLGGTAAGLGVAHNRIQWSFRIAAQRRVRNPSRKARLWIPGSRLRRAPE